MVLHGRGLHGLLLHHLILCQLLLSSLDCELDRLLLRSLTLSQWLCRHDRRHSHGGNTGGHILNLHCRNWSTGRHRRIHRPL